MEGLVFLSGEDPALAEGEMMGAIRALGGSMTIVASEGASRLLSATPPEGLASRMGFCHFDGTVSMRTGPGIPEIVEAARTLLSRDRPGSVGFIARSTADIEPRSIFSAIEGEAREIGVRVHHRHPSKKLFAVAGRECSYVGWVGSECDRSSLLGRRGSRMPFSRPIVMDPRLARAMVNLSGLPPGSSIMDPFMGPGGLAIEASHLGMRYTGIEIDPEILAGARRNIGMIGGAVPVQAVLGDSRDIAGLDLGTDRFDGIVTDPPFGRSASLKGSDRGELVVGVLEMASRMIDVGAPVVLDMADTGSLDGSHGYRIESEFRHRVHRSLTRHVIVLRRA
jgi:tRNA (guanine10-N2)-dimethyltransferase